VSRPQTQELLGLHRQDVQLPVQKLRCEKAEMISKMRLVCGVSKHPAAVIAAGFPSRAEGCSVRPPMNRPNRLSLSLLLAAAACGNVTSSAPADANDDQPASDGGVADAPPDGEPPPDAIHRGAVTVVVLGTGYEGGGTPVAGAQVIFVDTDGTVHRSITNSAGEATADLSTGASVTVVRAEQSNAYEITTFAHVEPLDRLIIGERARNILEETKRMTVVVPTYGTNSRYAVLPGCGQASERSPGVFEVQFPASCESGEYVVGALARDVDGTAIAQNVLGAPKFEAGARLEMGSWTPVPSFLATYSNIPQNVTSLSMFRAFLDHNRIFTSWDTLYPERTTGSPTVVVRENNFAFGTDMYISTDLDRPGFLSQTLRDRPGMVMNTYGVDVAAGILPWIRDVGFDPTSRTFSWTQDGSAPAEIVRASVSYDRQNPPLWVHWTTYAPGDASPEQIVLPTLPPEVGDIGPRSGDWISRPHVCLLDVDGLDAAAVRAELDLEINSNFNDYQHPVTRIRRSGECYR
jgi:hypothetical protein